jgi:hypothetical protein
VTPVVPGMQHIGEFFGVERVAAHIDAHDRHALQLNVKTISELY